MIPLWFGQEWEMAFSAVSVVGAPVPMSFLLDQIDEVLVRNVTHVNGSGSGWWLTSGGRWYRDASDGGRAHDEITTPECCSPDELLRQDRAAERLALRLAELAGGGDHIHEVTVSKATTCATSVVSWGLHENYETSARIPEQPMLAWLASRIALTGAGGLDVTYPGIRFTISPRAHFIHETVSSATQWNRSLHNVGKATPNGCRHRVHVIAGEGNRASLSTWLRIATTALVVRLLDLNRGPDVALLDPVAALHAFALDPSCRTSALATGQRESSMIGLQRTFLEAVQARQSRMPEWTARVLREWQAVLDTLESSGWRGLVGRLDWPTKLALFERVLERKGWSWEQVHQLNARLESTREHLGGPTPQPMPHGNREYHDSLLQSMAREVGARRVDEFRALRLALAATEARYMQLGNSSLFEVLRHPDDPLGPKPEELPVDPLELPMPPDGRAAVRAGLIREHGWKGYGDDRMVMASWTNFILHNRELPMPDVKGVTDLEWHASDEYSEADVMEQAALQRRLLLNRRTTRIVADAISQAHAAVDSGHYAAGGNALLRGAGVADLLEINSSRRIDFWRHMVRIEARRQRQQELSDSLGMLRRLDIEPLEWLWESCNAHVLLGLAGHEDTRDLIRDTREALDAVANPRPSGLACWLSHLAVWLNRNGRPREALETLTVAASDAGGFRDTSDSVRSRIEAQLGETWRQLGDFPRAAEYFQLAADRCRHHDLTANQLDYVATGRAKLLADTGERHAAWNLLREDVLPKQSQAGMPSALRTRMLVCRIAPEHTAAHVGCQTVHRTLTKERRQTSGFSNCRKCTKILSHWEAWCDGGPDPEPPADAQTSDTFWGV